MPPSLKNIWVAAGDGDLPRVQELIERQSISPNAPDPFTYTPMHAAASYGHLDILEYLVSRGGNVDITDSDGDTPLYTVESVDTARWLVEHGATVSRTNNENLSPIEHLSEDFPEVSNYLTAISYTSTTGPLSTAIQQQPSQHSQNQASEQLTSALMQSVHDIMERAEAEGQDPDQELRAVVGRTVLEGIVTGYEMNSNGDHRREGSANGSKRVRMDEDPS